MDGLSFASGDENGLVRIWRLTDDRPFRVLKGQKSTVLSVSFTPDGHLLSSSEDGSAMLWDVASGQAIRTFGDKVAGVGGPWVTAAMASHDGQQLVTSSYNGTIRLWDLSTGREIRVVENSRASKTCASFSPDDAKILTCSKDSLMRIWDAHADRLVATLGAAAGGITDAAFSGDTLRLAFASEDGWVSLWDMSSGSEINRYDASEGVSQVAMDQTGELILTVAPDGNARVLETATGKIIHEHRPPAGFVPHRNLEELAVLSRSGNMAVLAANGYEAGSYQEYLAWQKAYTENPQTSVHAVSPTAMLDAAIWDLRTGKSILDLGSLYPTTRLRATAISDDEGLVAASWGALVLVWRLQPHSSHHLPVSHEPTCRRSGLFRVTGRCWQRQAIFGTWMAALKP